MDMNLWKTESLCTAFLNPETGILEDTRYWLTRSHPDLLICDMKDFPNNKSISRLDWEKHFWEYQQLLKSSCLFLSLVLFIQVYFILVSLLDFQVRLGEGNCFASNICIMNKRNSLQNVHSSSNRKNHPGLDGFLLSLIKYPNSTIVKSNHTYI